MRFLFGIAAVAAALLPICVRAQVPVVREVGSVRLLQAEAEVDGAAAPSVPVGGILNNASYLLDNLPGDGVARGAMFAVFGVGLNSGTPLTADALPLGTELGGTAIEVTVSGVTRQAYLLAVSAGQLAAVMPSQLPAGMGTLTVIVDGNRSAPTPVKVVDNAFGIFTRNQAGFGPAIVQNFVSAGEQPVNSVLDVAHPGQVAILWGTGLGPIAVDDSGPPPVGMLPFNVEVWVGDRPAAILYAGRSPQFPAIDQINFTIPPGVVGCYVPVAVVVEGVVSNYVTMAIAEEGRTCSDFQTFRPGELDAVLADGQGSFGLVELAKFRGELTTPDGPFPVAVDQVLGEFVQWDAAQIAAVTSSREATAPLGSCIVARERSSGRSDPIGRNPLRAGSTLILDGPRGRKPIPQDDSFYEAEVGGGFGGEAQPEYFDPGEYTLRGGSDADGVGPFETTFTMTNGIEWLNPITTLRRDQDWTARWSGGDPAAEFVVIAIQSVNNDDGVMGSIFCSAPVEAGSFTVSQRHLGTLPANTPWMGEGDPTGLVSVGVESRSSVGNIQAPGLTGARVFYAIRQVRGLIVE